MIEVDIRTKIIPDDHRVVVARPGADYRLYPEFVDKELVGPELPSLFLEEERINPDDPDMVARIMRSKERRSWHRRGEPADAVPSEDVEDYDNTSNSQSTRQFLRLIDFYFKRAKQGDLIVVPPKNFTGDVYIGEFIDDPEHAFKWNSRLYVGDPLPARRIRWIGKFEKNSLDASILEALRVPTALFSVERSKTDFFYRRAYRNYHRSGGGFSSLFDVTEKEFNTFHGSVIPAFFNFVAANTKSIEEAGEIRGFAEGAFASLGEYAPDLAIDIQSPGILSIASPFITPLIASALLAIAVAVGADAASPDVVDTIRIGNSSAPASDPCVVDVERHVHAQLRLLGYDRWAEACERVRAAAKETGLKSESLVKP